MGVSERKAKEKEELKALILQAAKKLFIEKGIEQTTIRNIASEIEYSVGTVYVYYKDKNDILYDLHSQGFKQLGGEMKVLFSVADPMERMKALGRVYLRFALENPDMYDLMFTRKAPMDFLDSVHKEEWNEGKGTFDVLRATVAQCMDKGYFNGHQLEPLSFAIWSVVHGMASLHISQRIKGVNLPNPQEILMQGYEEFVAILDKA
ncbi:MAG: TetR/AcrR family transcriptional regulator [Algoriphagus sp.]|jgi:AcrR family transcriptional regulator|nr:TetR/AcrR family transcriptional regulator [Algoriphagus sp.]